MGATTFSHVAFGRDITEAYHAAVEEAQYDHGHDGYNGTISTTSGCFLIDSKGLKAEEFDQAIHEWEYAAQEASSYDERTRRYTEPTQAQVLEKLTKVKTRRTFKDQYDQRNYRYAQDRARRWRKYTPAQVAAITGTKLAKWEACGAIKLTGKDASEWRERHGLKGRRGDVFYFFGWAAY